jgi:hypothetical protein
MQCYNHLGEGNRKWQFMVLIAQGQISTTPDVKIHFPYTLVPNSFFQLQPMW